MKKNQKTPNPEAHPGPSQTAHGCTEQAASVWPGSQTRSLRCLLPPPRPLRPRRRVGGQGATRPLRPPACGAVLWPYPATLPVPVWLSRQLGVVSLLRLLQDYLLRSWCWFWHAAPGPHLLFKYHSQGLGGGKKKKRERKKTNMKYLLRFVDTHTHAHTTQTHKPGSGSLAAEEGRLWLRLSSKPRWRQSLLKGNPLDQN